MLAAGGASEREQKKIPISRGARACLHHTASPTHGASRVLFGTAVNRSGCRSVLIPRFAELFMTCHQFSARQFRNTKTIVLYNAMQCNISDDSNLFKPIRRSVEKIAIREPTPHLFRHTVEPHRSAASEGRNLPCPAMSPCTAPPDPKFSYTSFLLILPLTFENCTFFQGL